MKVYVASSWRNEAKQQEAVKVLRAEGHEVYDFRHPGPGEEGFGWRFCAPDPAALKDPRRFRDEVLPHPSCKHGFDLDMSALRDADATVLVLPCGRNAHLELGWAAGAGKRTIVLLDDSMSEPELMYLACSRICVSLAEVVAALENFARTSERVFRSTKNRFMDLQATATNHQLDDLRARVSALESRLAPPREETLSREAHETRAREHLEALRENARSRVARRLGIEISDGDGRIMFWFDGAEDCWKYLQRIETGSFEGKTNETYVLASIAGADMFGANDAGEVES